ncbi:MAG: hypothetical protein WCD60_23485 [Pseudolabrys sp.]
MIVPVEIHATEILKPMHYASLPISCTDPRRPSGIDPNALVPDYLTAHYWWAYMHPKAVKLFERQWLVNLILCGNYKRLRDAALVELGESLSGTTLPAFTVISRIA